MFGCYFLLQELKCSANYLPELNNDSQIISKCLSGAKDNGDFRISDLVKKKTLIEPIFKP